MPEATTRAETTADTSAVSTTEAITSAQQETLNNMGAAGAAVLEGLTKAQTEFLASSPSGSVRMSKSKRRCCAAEPWMTCATCRPASSRLPWTSTLRR